jgi:hypothetical protein
VQGVLAAMKPTDPATLGDQYTFIAISGTSKAIISYYTGKRTKRQRKRLKSAVDPKSTTYDFSKFKGES